MKQSWSNVAYLAIAGSGTLTVWLETFPGTVADIDPPLFSLVNIFQFVQGKLCSAR